MLRSLWLVKYPVEVTLNGFSAFLAIDILSRYTFLLCLSPGLEYIIAMACSNGPMAYSSKYCDPPVVAVMQYIREYANGLYFPRFAASCESGVTLTIFDRNNITWVTVVGILVKLWTRCKSPGMYI